MKIRETAILTSSSLELFIIAAFNLNFNILALMNNAISIHQIWLAIALAFYRINVYLEGTKISGYRRDSENVVTALELIPKEEFPNVSSIGSTFRLSE
jgi:hypothetical protein